MLLITTLPRTVDPRVPPLNSIVLDQRRGQQFGPCLGKTTRQELGSVEARIRFCQSTRACILPCPRAMAGDLCLVGMPMRGRPRYAPSGEVLGHRGNVAKLNVVGLQQHRC